MRIKQSPRVRYQKNPLIEVVAQVRFPRILELDEQLPSTFQKAIRSEYPLFEIQEELITISMQGQVKSLTEEPRKQSIYHFISADNAWRVSLTSEFIALTCTKYEKWELFEPRFINALEKIVELYGVTHISRIGLRYVDLIVKSDIGLNDVPWKELVATSLLGMSVADGLSSDGLVNESDIVASQTYLALNLGDCTLTLKHGLVQQEQSSSHAYIIDADFYRDNIVEEYNLDAIKQYVGQLHANSGNVFRACIQARLHKALGPSPV